MPTTVELPDKTEIEFPDGMDELAMHREIVKAFPDLGSVTPSESVSVPAPGAPLSRVAPPSPEIVPGVTGTPMEQAGMEAIAAQPTQADLLARKDQLPVSVIGEQRPLQLGGEGYEGGIKDVIAGLGDFIINRPEEFAASLYPPTAAAIGLYYGPQIGWQWLQDVYHGFKGDTRAAGRATAMLAAVGGPVAVKKGWQVIKDTKADVGYQAQYSALIDQLARENLTSREQAIPAEKPAPAFEMQPVSGREALIPKARDLTEKEAEGVFDLGKLDAETNAEIEAARTVLPESTAQLEKVIAEEKPAQVPPDVSEEINQGVWEMQQEAPTETPPTEVTPPAPEVPQTVTPVQKPHPSKQISIGDLTKQKATAGYSPLTGQVVLDKESVSKLSPEERAEVVRHELAHKIETEEELWNKTDTFLWDLWEKDRGHPIWDLSGEVTGRVGMRNDVSPEVIAELYAKHYPKGTFTVKERPVPYEWEGEDIQLPKEYPIPEPLMEVLDKIEEKLGIWKKKLARKSTNPPAPVEAPAAKEPAPAEIRRGEIGAKLSAGEVVLTSSGRKTTPFPEIDSSTVRKTQNTVRRVEKWLRDNAIAEAESRGDDLNASQFKSEPGKNIPQASKDAMEEYLFGQQPEVRPKFLREVKPTEPPAQSPSMSPGPGGAAAGEPGTYSAISQLSDKLKTVPADTPRNALNLGERIADTWSRGKSAVQGALGRLLAVPAALKAEYGYIRKFDDITRRIGEFDYAIQSSAGKSRQAGKVMRQSVRNNAMREGIAFLMEGATDAQLRDALANLPRGTKSHVRKALEAALALPDDVKAIASDMTDFFARRGQEAVDEGVMEGLLEDYYTHIWRDQRNMPANLAMALNRGNVNEYFQYARQRKIPTLLEGIAQGKEPLLDPAGVIPRYNYLLDRAIASRRLMKSLEELDVTETDPATGETRTRPLLAPTGTQRTITDASGVPQARLIKVRIAGENASDYRAIDHPSLRKWIWAATDEHGVPVFYEGDLRVHPQHYEQLARIMDRSRLTASKAMRAALRLSTEAKGFKLGVASFFHPIQVGTHAIFHIVNPLVRGEIDWDSPAVRFAIEKGGLKIGPDAREVSAYAEGTITRGLVNRIPIIGPLSHALGEWTFADYIPRLKLATFQVFYERNLNPSWPARLLGRPKMSVEEAAVRAGDSANSAYGELNQLWLGKDGRDPATQRLLRAIFLAPDFGEARLRFVGKALTRYGGEERLGLAVAGIGLYLAARAGNIMTHGDPEIEDWKHAFDVKVGGRWWGVRSIVGDIDHLIANARQFIEVRLNPIYSRTALAFLSGRDIRGRKFQGLTDYAADIGKQFVPIHLGGLTRDDQHLWESFVGAFGAHTWKASATAEVHRLAQDWRKSQGIEAQSETIAVADSPYRKARLALEFDDREKFQEAIEELRKIRIAAKDPRPRETIEKVFKRYYDQPFAGNQRLERAFKGSLGLREQRIYEDARKEQQTLWRKFKSWY